MNIYVILKNKQKDEYELEKFEEVNWKRLKPIIDPERIIYATPDIEDERLKNFNEIIWNRVYSPIHKIFTKIIIPFTPDKITVMNEIAMEKSLSLEKKYQEKYEQYEKDREERKRLRLEKVRTSDKFQEFIKAKETNDSLIPDETSEIDALQKWKELNFIMPPPKAIKKIKENYKMSWTDFIQHIKNNF